MAAMSLFTVACVEETLQYEAGEADLEGCYGVYFPAQEASGDHTYDPNMPTEITFTVARTNTKGPITVPVDTIASHAGVFELGEIKFEDGQPETTFKVTFPNSDNGVKYSLSIGISDPQYASKYQDGATNIDFSVLRVEWLDFLNPVTGEPAVVTFNEGWWDEVHTATLKYYEVNGVRTCVATCNETDEDGNPIGIWGDTQGITFNFTWFTTVFTPAGMQAIDVPRQYFGFDYADWTSKPEAEAAQGVYFYDWFHYLTTDGGYAGAWADWAGFLEKNPGAYDQSYYDGNGGFHFNLKYQVPALGGGFTPDVFDVVALADGFVRVDYSIGLEAGLTQDAVAPVAFTLGADVAKVKYAVYEGELNVAQLDAKVAAIIAGEEPNVAEVTETSVVGVTPAATGKYTLVAVAYDAEGNVQNTASTVFTYVAADAPVPVVVTAGLGSADKYVPSGASTETSLEMWIYGENLVDVKFGVFSMASLVTDMEACMAAVEESESISAEALALANGEGYVDVATGLVPGTEYYMIVWASNGYETTFVMSDSYTTSGDPLPVYQNYSTADIVDELLPATSEGYFGTYNYYAVDYFGESPLRQYLGQVTVADSELEDLPADDYGIVTEYVEVSGFFGAEGEYYGFDDTMTMEYYDGVLYQLPNYYEPTADGYYCAVMYFTADEGLYGHNNSYTMLGGFVDEGYIAFVDATNGYGFNGWFLRAFSDEAYATPVGNMACYQDVLLVDPEVDDNGLAPAPEAVSKMQLKQIGNMVNEMPANYVETERGRIRSIIDSVKSVKMYSNTLGIKGEREVNSVEFKVSEASFTAKKASKNRVITDVAF